MMTTRVQEPKGESPRTCWATIARSAMLPAMVTPMMHFDLLHTVGVPCVDTSLMNKHAAGDGGRSYTAASRALAIMRFCPSDFGWCECIDLWNIGNMHEQLQIHFHTTSCLVNRGADHGIRCDRKCVNGLIFLFVYAGFVHLRYCSNTLDPFPGCAFLSIGNAATASRMTRSSPETMKPVLEKAGTPKRTGRDATLWFNH